MQKLDEVVKKIPKSKDYITVPEAYALFGISKETLYRLIRKGVISSVNVGERQIRLSKEELLKLYPLRKKALAKPKPIAKLYSLEPKDCYTIGEISKKFHLEDSTVYLHIRKYSIPTRQIGNFVYVPKKEIDNLYKGMKQFSQIDLKLIESFRMFLLNAPQGGGKKGVISQNTASTYFSIFKAALKQAFIDGYLTVDIGAKVKGIQGQESRREYLTIDELNRLAQTPCDPLLKRAALFSALTGLRHCDIQKLKWSEIEVFNGSYRLNFTQQKTKGVEYMPISEQAFQLCGERKDDEQLVFAGLPDPSWINRPIKKWVAEAGITKHITYHCFRHSYATLQLAGGTDIYTVSKMLGHTNVRTTQVYAKVVDAKKEEATKTIKLDLPYC